MMRTLSITMLLMGWIATPVLADEPAALKYPAGAATFQSTCSVCHGAKGTGNPALAPPITGYPGRYATLPDGRKQLAIGSALECSEEQVRTGDVDGHGEKRDGG